MPKKLRRLTAILMLAAAAAFIIFALNNPQASFPWDNYFSYFLYALYISIILFLFIK